MHLRTRSKATIPTVEKAAQIEIYGPRARVYGVGSELDRELGYREVEASMQSGQVVLEQVWQPLVMHEEDHVLILTGMTNLAVGSLERRGYRTEVTDLRNFERERLEVDQAFVRTRRGGEKALVQALLGNPIGQVGVSSYEQSLEVISVMQGLWPRANILVPVATMEERARVQRDLTSILKMPVGVARGRNWTRNPSQRCVVCTLRAYSGYDRQFNDVIAFPYGHQAALVTCKWQFGNQHLRYHSRVYLMRHLQRSPEPREHWLMLGLAGPQVFRFPIGQLQGPGVRVHACTGPWQPTQQYASAHDRKRQAFWENDERNQFIADISSGLACNDHPTLWHHGLFLDGLAIPEAVPAPSITVLVESYDHAQRLLQRLRSWELRHWSDTYQARMPEDRTLIATTRWATRHGLESDIIVYAAGTATQMNFPDLPRLKQPAAQPGSQLLIDITDDFDLRAQMDSQRRMQVYRSRGWEIEQSTGTCR